MIEYVNLLTLLLTLLGIIYKIYYKYKIFFRVINILEKEVDSEVIKTKRGCIKKLTLKECYLTINEDTSDIIEKRDRLILCILSGNSKQY